MPLTVSHGFVSAVPDEGVPGQIEPSHWNAPHVITGSPTLPLPPGGALFPNWYVDPTIGSDSNDGLSTLTPFKTIQYAVDVASSYDYQGAGAPQINLADGTYNVTNQGIGPPLSPDIYFKQLHNAIQATGGYFIAGNSTTPANVVMDLGFQNFQIMDYTAAFFSGMHIKVGNFAPFINNFSSVLVLAGIEFEATTLHAGRSFIADNSYPFSTISITDAMTITNGSTAGQWSALFGCFQQATIRVVGSGQIVFTAPFDVTAGAMFLDEQFSFITCPSSLIINPGNLVGRGASVTGQSIFDGETASPTNYPGTLPSYVDQTSSWAFKTLAGTADYQAMVLNLSALPTTADLAQTGWGFFRDTSAGGRVGLYTNDAGTVFNVAPQIARVSTQFDKTSDVGLANIPGLSINVAAGATYEFTATLFTASNVAGGVKAAVGGTCTATSIIYEGETTQSAAVAAQTRSTTLGAAVGAATAVTAARMDIDGMITVNAAGTLTVQFAQNASNGAASSVLVGSHFTVQQVE